MAKVTVSLECSANIASKLAYIANWLEFQPLDIEDTYEVDSIVESIQILVEGLWHDNAFLTEENKVILSQTMNVLQKLGV